jgi:hypothetical protein
MGKSYWLPPYFQLQDAYKVVDTLKNTSGFSWDDKLGLNIGAQNEWEYKILEQVRSQLSCPLAV